METDSFLKAMSASFDEMRTANELVDIVLVFDGLKLPCHKVVLASTSEYFRRMFLAGFKESESDEVIMKDIDANTGKLLIQYLYSGKTDITEENAQDLLSASSMLLLSDLKDATEKVLCNQIQPPNCVSLLNLSHLHDLQDLIKQSQQFISDKWDEMNDASVIELWEEGMKTILKEHEFQETNFLRLQRWVKSVDERYERFMDMIQHVELSRCSKTFINNTVMDEALMHNTKGMKVIQQALKDICISESRTKVTFRYVVKDVFSLGEFDVSSSEYYMRGLLWKILTRQEVDPTLEKKSLVFGIACRSESQSTTWSCKGKYELRLLNQKPDGTPYMKKSQYLFRPNNSIGGFSHFISWDKLLRAENGYVKDDCIILEANIV